MVVSFPTPSKVAKATATTTPGTKTAKTEAPAQSEAQASVRASAQISPETTAPRFVSSAADSEVEQQSPSDSLSQDSNQKPRSSNPGSNNPSANQSRANQSRANNDTSIQGAEPHSEERSTRDRAFPAMGNFPPRLNREPRPKNSPHANVNLPPMALNRKASQPIPPLNTSAFAQEHFYQAPRDIEAEVLTLEMRPARLQVSNLWHRLRFNRFSPMGRQRRSNWKPGKPRRGRPEGTKGAGSRSL